MVAFIKRRRVELVAFERERITVSPTQMLCPVCQSSSEFLTTGQACRLAQVRTQTIYRWLASGKAHGIKTVGGGHRLCRNSLFRPFQIPGSQGVPYEQIPFSLSD
jgi:excisionase family DNA binding protein